MVGAPTRAGRDRPGTDDHLGSSLITKANVRMALSQSWKTRRYEPDDDPRIDALLRMSLPGYRGLQKWTWMHKGNPLGFHGSEGDVWVAESPDGSLVGYYGRIRYSLNFLGRSVLASQVINMATHPMFRRMGIATDLVTSSIRDAKKNGIALTFAFPNRNSYPLAVKEGAYDAGQASELHLVLDRSAYFGSLQSGPIRRTLRKAQFALSGRSSENHLAKVQNSQLEKVKGFTDEVDSVWAAVRKRFDFGLERGRRYFLWRYDSRWGDYDIISLLNRGMISGYVVTGTTKKGSLGVTRIFEFLSKDDDLQTYEALLDVAIEKAERGASAYVAISSVTTEAGLRSLRRRGFQSANRGARYVLFPYDEEIRLRIIRARAYHSFGDRDYL